MSFTPQAADAGRGGVIGTAIFSVVAGLAGTFVVDAVTCAGVVASVTIQDPAQINGYKISFTEDQPDVNYVVGVLVTDGYFAIMDTAEQYYQDASASDFGVVLLGAISSAITRVYVTVIRL